MFNLLTSRIKIHNDHNTSLKLLITYFIVVYLVIKVMPLSRGKAGVYFVLIQTSVLLICKCSVVSIRT